MNCWIYFLIMFSYMLNFHFQFKNLKIEEKHVKILEISVFLTYFVKVLE